MPRTTLAVSRTSVTAPVPRVAYQSADGPWVAARITPRPPLARRPAADGDRPAVGCDQARRETARAEPVRRPARQDDRGGARDVRVDARPRGDADRPPARGGGAAGSGVDDVVGVRGPAPDGGARGGEAAAGDRDRLRRRVGRRAVVVGDADEPAGRRRRSGDGEVAAEVDEHAAVRCGSDAAAAARSAASAFAVAPRSSSTPSGTRTVPRGRSTATARQPAVARATGVRGAAPGRSRAKSRS